MRVVATSRHRLGLAAEQVLPLDPLPVPGLGAAERAVLTPAVWLFTDRIRRVRPSFGTNWVGRLPTTGIRPASSSALAAASMRLLAIT
ncbi:MAG TPA: hypothetical protein DHU96_15925, partial [Actinobacteria bacterium]|nr:hypothetical protein [Actinomycetota bacterium]